MLNFLILSEIFFFVMLLIGLEGNFLVLLVGLPLFLLCMARELVSSESPRKVTVSEILLAMSDNLSALL